GLMAGAPLYPAQQRSPQPMPSPNAPNPNFPPGLDGPDQKQPDKKQMDRQNQAEVKAGVEKLYQLITELREQVQKSDSTSMLSLSVVKKAHEIEKLAKQVKDRAKG
ncbi:MAG: hypothetical protein ABLQ96_08270, partial [Candidatus Acidiferrum sp.]